MAKLTILEKIKNLTWYNLIEQLQEILPNFNKRIEYLEEKSEGSNSGGGGITQDLQQVLDSGNTAINQSININDAIDPNNKGAFMASHLVGVFNSNIGGTFVQPGVLRLDRPDGLGTGTSLDSYLTFSDNTPGVISGTFKMPGKSGGVYTLATLDDIPTPRKIYKALISQSGTSAPVVNLVLEDSIGGVTFTRGTNGAYTINLTGFAPTNCHYAFTETVDNSLIRGVAATDALVVFTKNIVSGVNEDNLLNATPITIEIY